jgi:hypothetical protein
VSSATRGKHYPAGRRRRAVAGAYRLAAAGLLALAALAGGCAPPTGGHAGQGTLLYVTNGQEGTVTRLEGQTGRTIGRPLPAGEGPRWVVAGANGRLLVSAAGASRQGSLTYVAPSGGIWTARPVPLEPGAQVTHLASDGEHTAAVIYGIMRHSPAGRPESAPCRLATIDLRSGAVLKVHPLCSVGETVSGLALEAGPGGALAYVAVWSEFPEAPGASGGPPAPSSLPSGRVLALHAEEGSARAAFPLEGIPGQLVLGPSPERAGRRLYSVSTVGQVEDNGYVDGSSAFSRAGAWQLLGLNPTTLEVESVQSLPFPPQWLAVAPDGAHAYALVGQQALTSTTPLLMIDLVSGDSRILSRVPGSGISALAVAGENVYVPDAMKDVVWSVDRRHGHLVARLAAGRRPLGITAGTA